MIGFLKYIGPQMGLPFLSMGGMILGLLLTFLGLLLTPFRGIFRQFKKGRGLWIILALALLGGLAGGAFWWAHRSSPTSARVIVLGLDGLDPEMLESYMQQGLLPNFQALKEKGSYARLGTTNPALSPVAWSSFITGSNPGRHGLYDFLRRDPKTYLPDLALSVVEGSKLKSSRKGVAFWDVTTQHRIPTTIIRTPVTFPPDKIHGRMLSGLGVPDVRGTQGTFAFYTTDSVETGRAMGGQIFQVKFASDTLQTQIIGPRNDRAKPPADVTVPLQIRVHRDNPHVTLQLQNQSFDLPVGKWSDWKNLTFKLGPFTTVKGIARFYLSSVDPQLELYMSPINFDPRSPAFPISHPDRYAAELAEELGLYYTLGQAEDTWSLNEGRLSDETFLEECYQVIRERESMLLYELGRFDKGLLVCCFDTPDRIQHMFWRFRDAKHPLYDKAGAAKFEQVFPDLYRSMDRILGKILESADEKTVVMVLSDHGFTDFQTAVHTNAWLLQKGLLAFKPGADLSGTKEFFQDVDWGRTKAYAVGLAGIYLNLRGRERDGSIGPEEVPAVTEQVLAALMELKDPATGKAVVKRVYRREEIYEGPYLEQAPDLVVGFEEGYRSSWQTALGAVPPKLFEPNAKRWSGDHCVDPPYVPGVLLVNRKIHTAAPRIIDVAPTILKLFGIDPPETTDGRAFL